MSASPALLSAVLLLLFSPALRAQSLPLPPERERLSDPAAGHALVQDLLAARPAHDMVFYGQLAIRDSDGVQRETPVRYQITVSSNGWKAAYETRPTTHSAAEKLTVIHALNSPNQYLFARASAPGQPAAEPRPIPPGKTYAPFGQSDFWICDLGLEFLHWPKQVLVAREMKNSRPAKVVESVNPNPKPGDYGKVRSWIDNESGGIIQAQAFDAKDKIIKDFRVRDLEKVNGEWQVKKIQMRNRKNDTETFLEFNYTEPPRTPQRDHPP